MLVRRHRTRAVLVVLVLGVLAALAACSSDDAQVSSGPGTTATTAPIEGSVMTTVPGDEVVTGAMLADESFTSTEVTGHDLVPGTAITLAFTDTSVSVNAGCNTMNGGYELAGNRLQVSDLSSTLMGCDEERTDQDAWVGEWLATGPAIAATIDGISLSGDGIDARFTMDSLQGGGTAGVATLVGPAWTVHTFVTASSASSLPAGAAAPAFTFALDGTYTVFTGCNQGSGTYVADDDGTIDFGEPSLTMAACADPSGQTTEAAITSLLVPGVAYSIEGGELSLTGIDGGVVASAS